MNPARKKTSRQLSLQEGALTTLELRVAKRADMLWRSAGYCRGRDLIHWLQAESEILDRYFLFERPMEAELAADR